MASPLDAQIARAVAALEALQRLKAAQQGPWPKRCTIYVHGSKESNYEEGEELGLSEAALLKFIYTAYEVALEYEVQEDGEATLVAVDGKSFDGERHGNPTR